MSHSSSSRVLEETTASYESRGESAFRGIVALCVAR